jgi:predicted PurR-regulated permease PerM
MPTFNNKVKQILILGLLVLMIIIAVQELKLFMPGILGAITLYILSRGSYFQLIYHRKWNKSITSLLFLLFYLLLLGLPIYLAISFLSPKINSIFNSPGDIFSNIKLAVTHVQEKVGITVITENSLNESFQKLTASLPSLLNNTVNLLTNLVILLFFLYYMLYHGKEMEKTLLNIIPLKGENINKLASETKRLIKASALGIPLISIIQGITATVGYYLFNVDDYILWGFLTGVFAFFPVVGTMIMWVPLVIYMFSTGETWNATGLLIYSVIITGNVDYLSRITIMRKMGDVHPVVTVLGVLIGLGLFGFIGLIFGPLLVSYIILLFKIYMSEFFEVKSEVGKIHGKEAKELIINNE